MKELIQEYKHDFTLLLEAGFIAVKQCSEEDAIALFAAAEALQPKSLFPQVGLAYMHLCMLNLPKSVEILEKVLAHEPYNEVAKTLLGIASSFMPTRSAKGEEILENCVTATEDPYVKKAASTALEFVDKFVKKPGSHGSKSDSTHHHKKY